MLNPVQIISEQDYLDGERLSEIKHEYLDGDVYAMAGASKTHGTLALNAAIAIRQHLRGKPCGVWMADMKVRVAADNAYYYPDLVATCDADDLKPSAPQDYLQAPCLIIEVLSESTETIDRKEKLRSYRQLASLQEYVLIDQTRPWVELYRLTDQGWLHQIIQEDEEIELHSIGLKLSAEALYQDTGLLDAAGG
ncbi:Uma2 family endonuclease [Magnetovirga frankeli]|uniref:Uma2 family endonuclease n=1 Tax=Magnetovirga frankeli TaxID=947516 RepID=UPI00129331FC|nr:Uma2 family endonuclease [gamma proteobacterium SS-5]